MPHDTGCDVNGQPSDIIAAFLNFSDVHTGANGQSDTVEFSGKIFSALQYPHRAKPPNSARTPALIAHRGQLGCLLHNVGKQRQR